VQAAGGDEKDGVLGGGGDGGKVGFDTDGRFAQFEHHLPQFVGGARLQDGDARLGTESLRQGEELAGGDGDVGSGVVVVGVVAAGVGAAVAIVPAVVAQGSVGG